MSRYIENWNRIFDGEVMMDSKEVAKLLNRQSEALAYNPEFKACHRCNEYIRMGCCSCSFGEDATAAKWELAYNSSLKEIAALQEIISDLRFHDKAMKKMADKKNRQISDLQYQNSKLRDQLNESLRLRGGLE